MTETVINNIRFRLANAEDKPAIIHLLATNPMKSWIRLATIPQDSTDLRGYVLAEDLSNHSSLIGLYHLNPQKLYLNGLATEVIYIGKLRVDPGYRNKIRILRSGFQSISQMILEIDKNKPWFTSIAAENSLARRILESGVPGLPTYQHQGNLLTVAISTTRGKNRALTRPAEIGDIEKLSSFLSNQLACYQFAPVTSREWFHSLPPGLALKDFRILEQQQKIVGCAAIWDQRKHSEIVVEGYAAPLNWLRGLYNFGARLFRTPRLPAAGQSLNQVILSFLAFQPDKSDMFNPFIQEMLYLAHQRNADLVLTGLHESNPHLPVIKRRFRPRIYRSVIDTVVPAGQPPLVLTGLLVQPEIGLL
jgi:hypothetical protein